MMGKKRAPISKNSFHYGWVIVIAGMAVLFSCLGLGRFSLGMLLPSMGTSMNLNYFQMGLIGTGNFVGYMVSVILAGIIAGRIGARKTIFIGLVIVGGSMALISHAMGFVAIICFYTATGMGSGLANVPMMGLVSQWFFKNTRGKAAGFMLSGNGLAIVFAGFFVPWINLQAGAEGWRLSWLIMGIMSLVIAVFVAGLLRNDPKEKGLKPIGEYKSINKGEKDSSLWTLVHLGSVYTLFGATYVVYATFIVTAMVNERGFGENAAGTFWAIVGGLSIISGPLFGSLSDRIGRRLTMMIVFLLFTISYVLAAARLVDAFLYASIVIFGLTVWSIPTIMSAAVGDYMGPKRAAKAFGFITVFFGIGQISGPAVAGFLTDLTGTFRMAFWLCAILTGAAMFLVSFLRPPSSDM